MRIYAPNRHTIYTMLTPTGDGWGINMPDDTRVCGSILKVSDDTPVIRFEVTKRSYPSKSDIKLEPAEGSDMDISVSGEFHDSVESIFGACVSVCNYVNGEIRESGTPSSSIYLHPSNAESILIGRDVELLYTVIDSIDFPDDVDEQYKEMVLNDARKCALASTRSFKALRTILNYDAPPMFIRMEKVKYRSVVGSVIKSGRSYSYHITTIPHGDTMSYDFKLADQLSRNPSVHGSVEIDATFEDLFCDIQDRFGETFTDIEVNRISIPRSNSDAMPTSVTQSY